MSAFVGVKEVDSQEELEALLINLSIDSDRYFLKWAHQVSGFEKQPSSFPSPEGQMFNRNRELRWKKRGQGYSLLLLSAKSSEDGFSPIGQEWEIQDRAAQVYPSKETRFPKGISGGQANIAQRYFIDRRTSTVRFVALTLK